MKFLKNKSILVLLSLAFILILGACTKTDEGEPVPSGAQNIESPIEAVEYPTASPPEEGMASMTGVINNNLGDLPENTHVFFAEYQESEKGWGVYFLDTVTAPTILVEPSGYFEARNIPAGQYVLVVGPEPEEAVVIADQSSGEAIIFTAVANEILDIGLQNLSINAPPTEVPTPSDAYPVANPTPDPYP